MIQQTVLPFKLESTATQYSHAGLVRISREKFGLALLGEFCIGLEADSARTIS